MLQRFSRVMQPLLLTCYKWKPPCFQITGPLAMPLPSFKMFVSKWEKAFFFSNSNLDWSPHRSKNRCGGAVFLVVSEARHNNVLFFPGSVEASLCLPVSYRASVYATHLVACLVFVTRVLKKLGLVTNSPRRSPPLCNLDIAFLDCVIPACRRLPMWVSASCTKRCPGGALCLYLLRRWIAR